MYERGGDLARLRPGEVEALPEVAAERPQFGELQRRLDALGRHRQAERVTQSHDRGDDRGVVGIVTEAVDEGAVDLEGVDRQRLQVAERRMSGAEVVDAQTH